MRKIQNPDMTVAVKSDISRLYRMRSRIADECGTDDKTVGVVMNIGAVVVIRPDCLNRVAFK